MVLLFASTPVVTLDSPEAEIVVKKKKREKQRGSLKI